MSNEMLREIADVLETDSHYSGSNEQARRAGYAKTLRDLADRIECALASGTDDFEAWVTTNHPLLPLTTVKYTASNGTTPVYTDDITEAMAQAWKAARIGGEDAARWRFVRDHMTPALVADLFKLNAQDYAPDESVKPFSQTDKWVDRIVDAARATGTKR